VTPMQTVPLQMGDIPVRLHFFMACCCALLFIPSAAVVPWYSLSLTVALQMTVCALPGLVRHEKKNYERRDAALVFSWVAGMYIFMQCTPIFAGGLHFPLKDRLFASLDARLGVNVVAIVLWMGFHPVLRGVLDRSYDLLPPFLLVAALAPALLGKKIAAERFLAANAIAFVTAVPVFCLLPAIGRWAGLGFPASSAQAACEQAIFAMRGGSHSATAGIVCLPSFHTVRAVLSASAFCDWRLLCGPATVLAILIVVSTLTTGWHYAVDVLAGLVWAFGSV
ncbi:MAG: phosphatase PAP2 family protein, partial [Candidatus Acidiferrales bacterium]